MFSAGHETAPVSAFARRSRARIEGTGDYSMNINRRALYQRPGGGRKNLRE
ncbi:MAG: hypothetical protein JWP94_3288 [Mucilaginibacter sp.]|nr:hypothetical protein [Mucilaginibacter sp.]